LGDLSYHVTVEHIPSALTTNGDFAINLHNLAVQPRIFNPTEGVDFNGAVAEFTDSSPTAPTADFTVDVDWGDGTSTSSVTIVPLGGGRFRVDAVHAYRE